MLYSIVQLLLLACLRQASAVGVHADSWRICAVLVVCTVVTVVLIVTVGGRYCIDAAGIQKLRVTILSTAVCCGVMLHGGCMRLCDIGHVILETCINHVVNQHVLWCNSRQV